MTYKLTENSTLILRTSDNTYIPADSRNKDYIAYLAWLAEGNIPAPAFNLAEAKEIMWEKIKARRDSLSETGGYSVDVSGTVKWFHSDSKSKTQQLGLVMAGASLPAIPWKTMNGSFVVMTPTIAQAIFQSALTQDSAIFAAAEVHKNAMEASDNPLNYDFSTGWPAVFEE
jgi:hypothetical protein